LKLVCLVGFSSYSICSTLLYASETDCKESNVEHEPELERSQFSDLVVEYKEILAGMWKILKSMAAKVVGTKPPVLVETEVEP